MLSNGEWRFMKPEMAGIEAETLSAVCQWLDTVPKSNIHSILVARHGALVFEHYRTGSDERWREALPDLNHGIEVRHDLRSVTKVVTGLLVGKALEQHLIASLDEPVFSFFPEYGDLRTPEKDLICLRDLLTMSAGLDWDENVPADDPRHGEMRLWRSDDLVRTALEPQLTSASGATWNYSGGCTELLAAILRKVSGKPIDEYAGEVLFTPLAIQNVEWARHPDGSLSGSGGLRMCSRDLARIGQLVIGNGNWDGEQVLTTSWIEQSLTPQIGVDDRLFFYGYHWWLGRSLVNRREVRWAAGIGLGGQRLFVIPELDLVVVITVGHYSDSMQAWLPLVILNRFVLPAVN